MFLEIVLLILGLLFIALYCCVSVLLWKMANLLKAIARQLQDLADRLNEGVLQ
jgi:uncharacterized membrane protein (Fun14 family)